MPEALEVVGDSHDVDIIFSRTWGFIGILTSMILFGSYGFDQNNGYLVTHAEEEESSSSNRLKMRLKEYHRSTPSFTSLDRNYLTPFFTTQSADDEEHDDLMPISGRESCHNNH